MSFKSRTPRCPPQILLVVAISLLVSQEVVGDQRLSVYTVNYPLAYFATRIGGNHVDVRFPAPQGIDPAFWRPDATTIGRYQSADLILLNGAGYAKWVSKAALPRSRSTNTSAEFAEDYITVEDTVTHTHGPLGQHAHMGFEFTTWLDFRQAVAQASAIMRVLVYKKPQFGAEFVRNFEDLERDLLALEDRLVKLVAKHPNRPLLASHPVYHYLARRYNLNLQSVTWEPDVFPNSSQWQLFSRLRQAHASNVMLWEAKPLAKTQQQLAAQNVAVVVFDPCANRPTTGDFLSVMQQNIKNLDTVLADQ